jgi:MFS family permease
MATAASTLRRTFEALESRPFRWLWLGRLATTGTFQMGTVVQGWLVYHLTGSAFALGWVASGWSVATLLLSPYGGVVADRLDKRGLMLWNRTGMLLNSLAIALLVSLDLIRVWHLAASSFLTGIFIAFLMPAQQAMITELVPERALMNAISLDSLGMGLMGIVAASSAGLLIDSVGAEGVYYLMAGMYAIAVYTISRLPKSAARTTEHGSLWIDIAEGIRYLRGESLLLLLIGLGLVRVFFVMPYVTLLPAFARENWGLDASGLGLLQSAGAAGALVASLIACYLGDIRGKGRLLLGASLGLGLCLALYVTMPWLPAVFLFLGVAGALGNLYLVLSNTLILSYTDEAYRGRVLSVAMMEWGLSPLGTIPAGAAADRVGVPWVVGVQGMIVVTITALVAILKPEMRRMD